MKKDYLTPSVELFFCKLEENILSAKVGSSTDMTITDDDGDWVY